MPTHVPFLFEPHAIVCDPNEGWRMFQITGRKSSIVIWVAPCKDAYCDQCHTAFVVHPDSLSRLAKACHATFEAQQAVCLCEGKFVE